MIWGHKYPYVFLWWPRRLTCGRWAWLTTVRTKEKFHAPTFSWLTEYIEIEGDRDNG